MKDSYIAAKERWARKMAGKEKPAVRSTNRLPPGQRQVHNFPVLDLASSRRCRSTSGSLRFTTTSKTRFTLKLGTVPRAAAIQRRERLSLRHDLEPVRHGMGGVAFSRSPIRQAHASATHVFFKSHDGYSTNNPLDVLMDDDVLIAHSWNGQPLPVEHGGPARVIVPKKYAWKGAKWIREITFLDRDILGFWEVRGYSNTADPWTEDRFA